MSVSAILCTPGNSSMDRTTKMRLWNWAFSDCSRFMPCLETSCMGLRWALCDYSVPCNTRRARP